MNEQRAYRETWLQGEGPDAHKHDARKHDAHKHDAHKGHHYM